MCAGSGSARGLMRQPAEPSQTETRTEKTVERRWIPRDPYQVQKTVQGNSSETSERASRDLIQCRPRGLESGCRKLPRRLERLCINTAGLPRLHGMSSAVSLACVAWRTEIAVRYRLLCRSHTRVPVPYNYFSNDKEEKRKRARNPMAGA